MKASELIFDLQTLIEQHGDLDVVLDDEDEISVEHNDDNNEENFVIC